MPNDDLSDFNRALWGREGPPSDIARRQDWPDLTPILRPALIPPPPMFLSQQEMQTVGRGYTSPGWDDRWLWYMEDHRLFLHRIGTGLCIYEVWFTATDGGYAITSAVVECERERYGRGSDLEEREQLCALILLALDAPTLSIPPMLAPRRPELGASLGDITALSVSAIVNPTSTDMLGGGGVDAAIHRASGPELRAHCETLGTCELGRAEISPGFELAASWVIHTVGPQWRGGTHGEPVLLESCYRESLARADEVGAESVAFPAIATGAHGYPVTAAAEIAVSTVRSTPTKVREIRFVCFDVPTLEAYERALSRTG